MLAKKLIFIVLILIVTASSFKLSSYKRIDEKKSLNHEKDIDIQRQDLSNELVNLTNSEFISLNDMQRWGHVNKTFQYFNDLRLNYSTIWKVNESKIYTIENATPTFTCNDQNQKAGIVASINIVVVQGVHPRVNLNFTWKIKSGSNIREGFATAQSLMDEIVYAIEFTPDKNQNGFINNSLYEYFQLKFSKFQLITVSAQISQQQKSDLTVLLNNASTAITIMEQFAAQIKQKFPCYLQSFFQDIQSLRPQKKSYYYSYFYNQKQYNIETVKIPTFFKTYSKLGFLVGYTNSVQGLQNQQFKFIETPPILPAQTYGGKSQFVSYQFYRNFLSLLIQQNWITSKISKSQWATKEFRFFAFELFSIFSNLDTKFAPSDEVVGTCTAKDSENITVGQSTNSTFNVTFNLVCNFTINEKNIVDIDIALGLQIFGMFRQGYYIDFWIKSLIPTPKIKDIYGFKLVNKPALVKIIRQVSYRLAEKKIAAGSGWKLPIKPNNPILTVRQTGTYVTDLDAKPKHQ